MTASTRAVLQRSAAWGLILSPAQLDVLVSFARLLEDRAVPLGLIAASDRSRIAERHLLDCLRAATAVRREDRAAYDLGSGAGLPGIVVAIARPALEVGLVESRRRRVAFLELAISELGLTNAQVVAGRVEDLTEPVDLCFARAFAPLSKAWQLAQPLLRPDGRLVFFSGQDVPPVPEGVRTELVRSLESPGTLVIMAR